MHVIEQAASGRARCRGCSGAIAKGELRFGEKLPSPFAEGEVMTLWFHLHCAAYKRPEPFLEGLRSGDMPIEDGERLAAQAELGLAHRRLPRVDGAERAPTGRARCRSCKEAIQKGAWRIRLVYFEEGRFQPSGFIHAQCSADYLGTVDVVERARHFARKLDDGDVASLREALTGH